jgi:hypothetical protein
LLAAICDALGAGLSDVLSDVSATFALVEQMESAFNEAATSPVPAASSVTPESAVVEDSVTDGDVTVSVRSDGPLRTTLTAKRTPGPRHPESLFVG